MMHLIPLLLAAAPSASCSAPQALPPILQPATYQSRSKTFTLEIDPTDRHCAGEGRYRLARGGKLLWEKDLPFTLFRAGLADDGTFGGYAYPKGNRSSHGSLDLIVVDPTGSVLRRRSFPRSSSRMMHGPPHPEGRDVVLAEEDGVIAISVGRLNHEENTTLWFGFGLSSGEPVHGAQRYWMHAKSEPTPRPVARWPVEWTEIERLEDIALRFEDVALPEPKEGEGGDEPAGFVGSWGRIDRSGNLLVLEKRTRLWTVFDRAGEVLVTLRPPAGVRFYPKSLTRPSQGRDGHWFFEAGSQEWQLLYLEYDASGALVAQHPVQEAGTHSREPRQFRSSGVTAWCDAQFGKALELRDGVRVLEAIRRRPDGAWIRSVGDFHLSSSGKTLAVFETMGHSRTEGDPVLCLYDSAGQPWFSVSAGDRHHFSKVVTSDDWTVVHYSTGIALFELNAKRVHLIDIGAIEGHKQWGLSPEGDQLWCLVAEEGVLHRFALPEE